MCAFSEVRRQAVGPAPVKEADEVPLSELAQAPLIAFLIKVQHIGATPAGNDRCRDYSAAVLTQTGEKLCAGYDLTIDLIDLHSVFP